MAGLHGVADTSRPCSPLDLVRSPAERLESTRFAKCVLPLSLPFSNALRDRSRTCVGAWRRCVSVRPCRCGSVRARHGRMAGTRAKTRDGRRRGRRKFPVSPLNYRAGGDRAGARHLHALAPPCTAVVSSYQPWSGRNSKTQRTRDLAPLLIVQ